jgi:hypothetical protein
VTPKTADTVMKVLNKPDIQDALKDYIQERIEVHRVVLETAKDLDTIRSSQGSIEELKKFAKFRQTAIDVIGNR